MIIGVPRERKPGERRVAIIPDGAKELVESGHQVVIERSAGELSGFGDDAYRAAGAKILPSLAEVWKTCELLVKVKEPAPEEIQYFRPGLAVFSFLHLAVAPELTREMVNKQVIGLDYDLVQLPDGRLPILEPMSIIAGKLSIQCGAYALQAGAEGRGILLGGCVGVKPGKVVVIGAGAAGHHAAKVAIGLGAEVTVLDINPVRLMPFTEGPFKARTLYSTSTAIERELVNADLVVGAVLIPGALAPKLVTRKMLSVMKRGAVIVDICIDQGGVAESSRPTTISEPTYIESGVVHYCVTNMPALVPHTSTIALTNATLGWVRMLADRGIEETLRTSEPMRMSLTSYRGKLTNDAIGKAIGLQSASKPEIEKLIG